MRICHVIESGATGALEMALLAANIQVGQGHRVLVVYSRRPGLPADLRARARPEVGLEHLRMRPLLPYLPLWCHRFARLLRRWRPDVLHLHCSRAGFVGRLVAGRRYAHRTFYSPHCISLMHLDLSTPARRLYRALERLAQRACPAVYLACSPPERDVIVEQTGAPTRLLENALENGLDSAFAATTPRPDGAVRRVVTCARIASLKDPALFAEICRSVRSVRPGVEFRWIGDGDPADRRMLERAGVRVTGWVSRTDALRHVAAGCVYLSTSGWEGMPVSVLEAMFLKVPVLCRRADWSSAIVRDGATGRLFDDAPSAARALLADDPAWRVDAAAAAWSAATERFSEARFADDLARLYRDMQAAW